MRNIAIDVDSHMQLILRLHDTLFSMYDVPHSSEWCHNICTYLHRYLCIH